MPKIIELTVELDVLRVSCPGVWLCQDGRVSLTVYMLGTSYQTCLLPPIFPFLFRDVFYFRKRFQKSCALNNLCCMLKEETIYCELVQWCEDCRSGGHTILAQYLGALNDVLFPPNMCANDGVDLLMRRSKEFPGILSPKIEITTKVRIDEVWNTPGGPVPAPVVTACSCQPRDELARQKQVCHSAKYHRNKCFKRSRSRCGSEGSRSACSLTANPPKPPGTCWCPPPSKQSCKSPRSPTRQYTVYNVQTMVDGYPEYNKINAEDFMDHDLRRPGSVNSSYDEVKTQRTVLESRFVEQNRPRPSDHNLEEKVKKLAKHSPLPCVCQICKRYHELFNPKSKLV